MKFKDILKWVKPSSFILALIGFILAYLIFGLGSNKAKPEQNQNSDKSSSMAMKNQIWTCAMHPQIRLKKAGKCPLCGMDLIPAKNSMTELDDSSQAMEDSEGIQMSPEAMALANIETTKVGKIIPSKIISLYGSIQVDEKGLQSQSATISGRIEELKVDITGQSLDKGQSLALIYSPELYNAQQDLLQALKLKDNPNGKSLVEAAREKLRLWKLSDQQIAGIEKSGKASAIFEIKSNCKGFVISKNVNQGDYVKQGQLLFQIADLSKVWAVFDAFQTDLSFLKVGDSLVFSLPALGGTSFGGRISFIDPFINKNTRTARVRIELANPKGEFKPEMYANASVRLKLNQAHKQIVIPKSSVLWTGKRSLVYVQDSSSESPRFKMREITLGPFLGDAYIVEKGLNPGEIIISNGVFSVDASAELEGKKSMMNQ